MTEVMLQLSTWLHGEPWKLITHLVELMTDCTLERIPAPQSGKAMRLDLPGLCNLLATLTDISAA